MPSSLNVDGEEPELGGEAPTVSVGETATVTWRNTGKGAATINDETNSAETVVETTGTAWTTIAAGRQLHQPQRQMPESRRSDDNRSRHTLDRRQIRNQMQLMS